MDEEERIHNAKEALREIGYTLLKTQGDSPQFVIAHLGSETIVNDPANLEAVEELVYELKEEAWRRP
jgi:hypothetical protein